MKGHGEDQDNYNLRECSLSVFEELSQPDLYIIMESLYYNLFGRPATYMQGWGIDELIHWFQDTYHFDGAEWKCQAKLIH